MMNRMAFVVVFLGLFAIACGGDPALTMDDPREQDYDAWSIHDADGTLIDSGMRVYPTTIDRSFKTQRRALSSSSRTASIHPKLQESLDSAPDEESLEVILAVSSAHKLSSLPRFDPMRDRDDPSNEEVLTQRLLIQEADDQLRALERAPVAEAIRQLGGEVTEEFRVGNAVAATMTAGALRRMLSTRADIAAASPAVSGEEPASYQIDDGIDRQHSDWYVGWGYDGNGYRIGLLDTGVYASHNVFNNPDPIIFWRDCAYTLYSDCSRYPVYPWNVLWDPNDTRGSGGHGTFMANVLVGNDNIGSAYEGVAPEADLDSTNVYTGTDHSSLYTTAVLRAFNFLDAYDDVIVANITSSHSHSGTISLAADDLYDQGVIVIAPVGNNGLEYAHSPANAHKVLGIGAYYTSNGNDWPASGGTSDSRFKPDVTAPTKVYGAANTGVSNTVEQSGTCPGAVFAGGAATLLRDYYDYRGWSSDPGAIYSAMITFGDEGGSDLDNIDGAGNLELGGLSSSYWLSGVRTLSSGETQHIYFYAGNSNCALRAGIWWAEDEDSSYHNRVYQYLYYGSTLKASSTHSYSVFQKVMHTPKLSSGWWKMKLSASVLNPDNSLEVYYLIHMATNCIF